MAVVPTVPDAVLLKAVVASARRSSAGVVVGVLVKRYLMAGMLVAEDVAAPSTVVATDKAAESTPAGGIVADGGLRVRLWSC